MGAPPDTSPVASVPLHVLAAVLVAAAVVQAAFLGLAVKTTGQLDGLAYRSIDGQEFMSLARNIARHGRFTQDENPPFHPDTWRCPGYPLLLAACVGILGDTAIGPILLQQVLAVGSAGLLVLIASRWTSPRRAGLIGLLWLLDPYRGYYTLWILSETWFVLLLLLGLWVWQRWMDHRTPVDLLMVGVIAGFAILTRPIAAVLIPPILVGALVPQGRFRQRLVRAGTCAIGLLVPVGPWVARNKLVAGRFALSHQPGTVLTYYKAVEVVLWAEGRTRHRYTPAAVHDVWERFDERVRRRWSALHGPLSPKAEQDVAWPQIAWGRVRAVNPLLLDREVRHVGLETLVERPGATLACWMARCASILTFPLTLAL